MQCTIVHSRKDLLIHWGQAMSSGDHILRAKNDRYLNFFIFYGGPPTPHPFSKEFFPHTTSCVKNLLFDTGD